MAKNVFLISFVKNSIKVWAIPRSGPEPSTLIYDEVADGAQFDTERLVQTMRQSGYRNEPVVVGLDSYQVLSLTTPPGLNKFSSVSEFRFALEEHCPVDAENIAAKTLGQLTLIAMRDQIEPTLTVLLDNGVRIQIVIPNPVMVYDLLNHQNGLGDDDRLLIETDRRVDILSKASGQLARWAIAHSDDDSVEALRDTEVDQVFSVVVVKDDQSQISSTNDDFVYSDRSFSESICERARQLLIGQVDSSVNFVEECCGDDAINPLKPAFDFVFAAAIFLVVCIAGVMFGRSVQVKRAIENTDSQLAQLLDQTIPNHPKTRMVNRMLTAEKDRLLDQAKLAEDVRESRRLIETLYLFLTSVPDKDVRFVLDTIVCTPNEVLIEGQALNKADYDRLKASLATGLKLISVDWVNNEFGFSLRYHTKTANEDEEIN